MKRFVPEEYDDLYDEVDSVLNILSNHDILIDSAESSLEEALRDDYIKDFKDDVKEAYENLNRLNYYINISLRNLKKIIDD